MVSPFYRFFVINDELHVHELNIVLLLRSRDGCRQILDRLQTQRKLRQI